MGLFNFVKDAGEKLWDNVSGKSSADQTEKLKEHLLKMGLDGLKNVNVAVKDDVVQITGDSITQEVKEKMMLALGNVAGISKVEDNVSVTGGQAEARFYTVKKGDTLSTIAKAEYGNANDYMVIFEANKPMLTHPDKIYPGQVLRIPQK